MFPFSTTTIPPDTLAAKLNYTNMDEFLSPKGIQNLHQDWHVNSDSWWITKRIKGALQPVKYPDSFGWVNSLKSWIPTQATKEVTFRRSWDSETIQVEVLNDRAALSHLPPNTPSFFESLDKVALVCNEFTYGQSVLSSLSEGTVPMGKCHLELTEAGPQGKTKRYNVEEILIGGGSNTLSLAQRTQLTTFLRYLVIGDYSSEKSKQLLEQKDFKLLAPAFIVDGPGALGTSSMGGNPFTDFHATTPVTAKALSLLRPDLSPPQHYSGSLSHTTDCGVIPTSKGSSELTSNCGHFLAINGDKRFIFKTEHTHSTTTAYSNTDISGPLARSFQGVTQSSSTELIGDVVRGTFYHGFFSRLNLGIGIGMPKSSNLALNLLIPMGMGISFAGLYYAKTTYESTKSNLRKVVGCATGIAATIFGMAISSIPFGSFKNR